MKLSVILPCYNEAGNVPRFATELIPVLETLPYDWELIVVDDGSRDNTVAEVKKINDGRVRLALHGVNQGLGAAVRTGIAAASGDLTITLDSDLTFHPRLIPRLTEAFTERPDVDFVIGSPQLGGYGEGIPAWRLWISKLANYFYGLLLGHPVTSINQIFRLYKTEQIKSLPLTAVGFDINAEILFKLVFSGRRFVEAPAELTARLYGVSKLNYWREMRRHLVLFGKIVKWKTFGLG